MKRTRIDVSLGAKTPEAEPAEYELILLLGDQLRGELEVTKRGLSPERHGIHFLSLATWAAMVRMKLTEEKFDEWVLDVWDLAEHEEPADVDPTQPDPSSDSSSPSSSHTPGPRSIGGETESSTATTS